MSSITEQIESDTFDAGKVVKVHGVNGRIVIRLLKPAGEVLDFPEWLFVRIDGGLVPFRVAEESVFQKDASHLVVGLDNVTGPEQAAGYVGLSCYLEGAWTDWFEVGSEDIDSLTGYILIDEMSGKTGIVTGFENIPGNPLLKIEIEGKSVLLPLNPEFVILNDPKKRQLILRIPDGLLDL